MFGINFSRTDVILTSVIIVLLLIMLYSHYKRDQKETVNKEVDVKELVVSVRRALATAETERINSNEKELFKFKECTLELNFVAKEGGQGSAGVEAKVVTVGSEYQYSSESIQKITLHLEALPGQAGQAKPNPASSFPNEGLVIDPTPPKEDKSTTKKGNE